MTHPLYDLPTGADPPGKLNVVVESPGLDDVPPHYLEEVRHFFAVYKDLHLASH